MEVKDIKDVSLESEIEGAYLDYAMSVIVGRALPDVRDGLKPVQRRIMFAMEELGNTPDKPYKKCARVVGEVLGKFHPHGDTAVYDALTRMAQSFSYREPLVDGHGNFGSIDGDAAAAMRYTEARLSYAAVEMLKDIEQDTVEFIPNFDGTLIEPTVLPSRFPNLLINGSYGIAVGMATSIPPHNLAEVVQASIVLLDNEDITIEELSSIILGPDFPTGGTIIDRSKIQESYKKGKGTLVLRGKIEEEKHKDRTALIITEVPYQTNKSQLVSRIAELIKDKKLSGATEVRDESDKRGIRVVIETKKDVNTALLKRQLFKHTPLSTSYSVIMLALVDGLPKLLSIKDFLVHYLNHRKEVVMRRSKFELKKLLNRKHLLDGILVALLNIDEVIVLIRSSQTPDEAKEKLVTRFSLSPEQAQAILDIRLERLTHLEKDKLLIDIQEMMNRINYLQKLLEDPALVIEEIKVELKDLERRFAAPRLTTIIDEGEEVADVDLIADEPVIFLVTKQGHLKQIILSSRNTITLSTIEEELGDGVVLTSRTKTPIYLFTNLGKGFKFLPYMLPDVCKGNRGLSLHGFLGLEEGERVVAMTRGNSDRVVFFSNTGRLKATSVSKLMKLSKRGTKVMGLAPSEELAKVLEVNLEDELVSYSEEGRGFRFSGGKIPLKGLRAQGVGGMKGATTPSIGILKPGELVFSATNKGFLKLMDREEIPLRGIRGKGVALQKTSPRTGKILIIMGVSPEGEEFTLFTKSGKVLRCNTSEVRLTRRTHKGVRPDSQKIKNSPITHLVFKRWLNAL